MKKVINLYDEDMANVTFKCRYITDRKTTNVSEPFFRSDMFWVEVKCDEEDLGSVSIDPDYHRDPTIFHVNKNWCKVEKGWNELRDMITVWFIKQPEYKKQIEWTKDLMRRIELLPSK